MNGDDWSPEDVHRLHKLREAGHSYSEIGSVLGRSREAVAGKIARIAGYKRAYEPVAHSTRGRLNDSKFIAKWKDRQK